MPTARILVGDVRERLSELADGSVQTCVTSPPYWGLRDYGHDGQIGLEQTPDAYVAEMVAVFREVRRVLADDGTLWLNLGDSYASDMKGSGGTATGLHSDRATRYDQRSQHCAPRKSDHGLKPKDLVGIPWRVAFALQADGWWLRQDIIWVKPNPMPESVTDRCTKAHEYVFLLSKSARYYYDAAAVREDSANPEWEANALSNPNWRRRSDTKADASRQDIARLVSGTPATLGSQPGRNKRSVWTVVPEKYKGAHFAVMPEALAEPCVLAGSRPGDLVLDPFAGSGTVGVVALKHGRDFVGTELNPEYAALAEARIRDDGPLFNEVEVA